MDQGDVLPDHYRAFAQDYDMAKAKCTKLIGETGLTFKWSDDTEDLVLWADMQKLQAEFFHHGVSQKLGDSYANSKSVAEAKVMFQDTLDALKAGDWTRKGGGSGGIWVIAFARAVGKSEAETQEKWREMSEEQRKDVKAHPDVKAEKAQIDVERAQKAAAKAASGDDVKPLVW